VKTVIWTLIASAFAVRVAAAATPLSDLDKFKKAISKYAPEADGATPCVCLDPTYFFYGATGFTQQTTENNGGGVNLVVVRCEIQGFDPITNERTYGAGCLPFALIKP